MSWTIKVTEVSSFVSSVDCEEKKMESITSSKLLGNAWHIKLSTDQTILDVITKIFGLVATAPSCLDKVHESEWNNQSKDSRQHCKNDHSLGVRCSVLIPFGTWCLVFILLVLGVLSVWYLVLGAHTAGARGQESEIAHCNRVVDGSLFMILLSSSISLCFSSSSSFSFPHLLLAIFLFPQLLLLLLYCSKYLSCF